MYSFFFFRPATLSCACFGSELWVESCLTRGLHRGVHLHRPKIIKMIGPGVYEPQTFAECFLNGGYGCLFHFLLELEGKIFFFFFHFSLRYATTLCKCTYAFFLHELVCAA